MFVLRLCGTVLLGGMRFIMVVVMSECLFLICCFWFDVGWFCVGALGCVLLVFLGDCLLWWVFYDGTLGLVRWVFFALFSPFLL